MQHEAIEKYLCQLNLKGMLHAFHEGPDNQSMTSEQWEAWVLALLEAEGAYRETRSYRYRLSLARLPQMKTFEDFEVAHLPIDPGKIEQLRQCHFIATHENILLIGGSGTGKTHMALALAHKALQKNYRIRFYPLSELARSLLTAQAQGYASRLMAKLMRFHMLVIDELGYLPIDQQAGALLFELFSGLYEKASIVMTTHLAFDEWAEIFGNKKSTKALIDRFTHHCHIVETGNESWRLKEVKTGKK